jgi:pimeloyl-ACP methyl ester carboxylesterase
MTLARAALLLLASAALLALLVRLLEPRLAFFPSKGETTTPLDFGIGYEPLTIETADGERLRAWHISSTQPPFVVYFHGNGGNLSNWAPILTGIARQGYSVLAFDYRGYGVSTGRPTEKVS